MLHDALDVDVDGHVGTGTTSPIRNLHIRESKNGPVGIEIENTNPGNSSGLGIAFVDENGEINAGRCHIELDPLFLECITVNKDRPLKVFVQLTSPLVNQFYVDKGETGLDVVVVGDSGGTAAATFDYKVMGKWKCYENLRFELVTGLDGLIQESSAPPGRD